MTTMMIIVISTVTSKGEKNDRFIKLCQDNW